MATKADFSEAEWSALQKGLTGSAMLVSLADRDFTDTFGEVGAMTKYLQGQQLAAASEVIRELAKTHGTGFGLTTSPETMRAETMGSLQTGVAALTAKAPDELDAYRQLVLGAAQAVADAKGGVKPAEGTMLEEIRRALDGGAPA
jgi:tellurite resistance protein